MAVVLNSRTIQYRDTGSHKQVQISPHHCLCIIWTQILLKTTILCTWIPSQSAHLQCPKILPFFWNLFSTTITATPYHCRPVSPFLLLLPFIKKQPAGQSLLPTRDPPSKAHTHRGNRESFQNIILPFSTHPSCLNIFCYWLSEMPKWMRYSCKYAPHFHPF